jgi:hypothetical protein
VSSVSGLGFLDELVETPKKHPWSALQLGNLRSQAVGNMPRLPLFQCSSTATPVSHSVRSEYPHIQKSLDPITPISADLVRSWIWAESPPELSIYVGHARASGVDPPLPQHLHERGRHVIGIDTL